MEKAFEFFMIFAQTECALKMLGFHYGEGSVARPNWEMFIRQITGSFNLQAPEITTAVHYLTTQPPKKQWIRNGVLCWEDVPSSGNIINDIFLSIRRVRNNLFHGGKLNGHILEAPDRSNELFDSCIAILNYCRTIHPPLTPQ